MSQFDIQLLLLVATAFARDVRAWRNGRRDRFRIYCRKAYEFESLRPHHFCDMR